MKSKPKQYLNTHTACSTRARILFLAAGKISLAQKMYQHEIENSSRVVLRGVKRRALMEKEEARLPQAHTYTPTHIHRIGENKGIPENIIYSSCGG